MTELQQALLTASDSQLDASMKPLIEKWSNPPKAIEILEVLDLCIHGGLASGFVISTFQALYISALKHEVKTHEQIVPLATWRNEYG